VNQSGLLVSVVNDARAAVAAKRFEILKIVFFFHCEVVQDAKQISYCFLGFCKFEILINWTVDEILKCWSPAASRLSFRLHPWSWNLSHSLSAKLSVHSPGKPALALGWAVRFRDHYFHTQGDWLSFLTWRWLAIINVLFDLSFVLCTLSLVFSLLLSNPRLKPL